MPVFIELTCRNSGDEIFVNMDKVAEIVKDKGGSNIIYPFEFEDDWAHTKVKESPMEIIAAIGCR